MSEREALARLIDPMVWGKPDPDYPDRRLMEWQKEMQEAATIVADRILAAGWRPPPEPWNPATSPGMMDLMVPPETLDAFMAANPLPPEPQAAAPEVVERDKIQLTSFAFNWIWFADGPQISVYPIDEYVQVSAQDWNQLIAWLNDKVVALAARADSLSSQIQTVLASRQETLDMAGAEIRKHSERAHDAEAKVKRLMQLMQDNPPADCLCAGKKERDPDCTYHAAVAGGDDGH